MGYLTHVTGEIAFQPPIPWGVVKGDEYLKGWDEGSTKCVRLRMDEQTTETDEGTLIRRSATAIVPISGDRFRAYNIDAQVRELVARYCSPGGRMCTGRLEGEGEESGDLWRICVRDGEVVWVVPRIIWPDNESEI